MMGVGEITPEELETFNHPQLLEIEKLLVHEIKLNKAIIVNLLSHPEPDQDEIKRNVFLLNLSRDNLVVVRTAINDREELIIVSTKYSYYSLN